MDVARLIGNVTRVKKFDMKGGGVIISFGVAEEVGGPDKNTGEYKSETKFQDCKLFPSKGRYSPEKFVEQVEIGDPVLVWGYTRKETWQKDGQEKVTDLVVVQGFFVGKRKSRAAQPVAPAADDFDF